MVEQAASADACCHISGTLNRTHGSPRSTTTHPGSVSDAGGSLYSAGNYYDTDEVFAKKYSELALAHWRQAEMFRRTKQFDNATSEAEECLIAARYAALDERFLSDVYEFIGDCRLDTGDPNSALTVYLLANNEHCSLRLRQKIQHVRWALRNEDNRIRRSNVPTGNYLPSAPDVLFNARNTSLSQSTASASHSPPSSSRDLKHDMSTHSLHSTYTNSSSTSSRRQVSFSDHSSSSSHSRSRHASMPLSARVPERSRQIGRDMLTHTLASMHSSRLHNSSSSSASARSQRHEAIRHFRRHSVRGTGTGGGGRRREEALTLSRRGDNSKSSASTGVSLPIIKSMHTRVAPTRSASLVSSNEQKQKFYPRTRPNLSSHRSRP